MSLKNVVIIDHKDSFSSILQQYCKNLGAEVTVLNPWEHDSESVSKENPTHLLFSPGPGSVYKSTDIGNSAIILQNFKGRIPILGVCLGHQLIGLSEGARIIYTEPSHGKISHLRLTPESLLFKGVPQNSPIMRYHSMVIDSNSRDFLKMQGYCITAISADDENIMAIENKDEKTFGVQFHPESFATNFGLKILENFLNLS